VNIRDCNQPRIVYTDSGDSVLQNETLPFLIGQRESGSMVRQSRKCATMLRVRILNF
jgi:hypothetical protein